MASSSESTPAQLSAEERVRLCVHTRVGDLQRLHGASQGDFDSYRRYLARRLRKVRVKTNVKHGRGRAFIPRSVTVKDVVKNSACVEIPLLNCERAWAYAMQVKHQLASGGSGGDVVNRAQLHAHMRKRLVKAQRWCDELKALAEVVCDPLTCQEVEAYRAYMCGVVSMEAREYTSALTQFDAVIELYTSLCTTAVDVATGNVDMKTEDLYNARIDAVKQHIRFCNYSLAAQSGGKATLKGVTDGMNALSVESTASSDGGATGSLSSVSFGGVSIDVADVKLRKCVVAVNELVNGVRGQAEASEAQYSSVIHACDDALKVARSLIEQAHQNSSTGERVRMCVCTRGFSIGSYVRVCVCDGLFCVVWRALPPRRRHGFVSIPS